MQSLLTDRSANDVAPAVLSQESRSTIWSVIVFLGCFCDPFSRLGSDIFVAIQCAANCGLRDTKSLCEFFWVHWSSLREARLLLVKSKLVSCSLGGNYLVAAGLPEVRIQHTGQLIVLGRQVQRRFEHACL